jgi:hypothetical protein
MNQERVLAVFSTVINHFLQWLSATEHSLFVIECGFFQDFVFHTNIGKDLINKIYIKCCSNNIQKFIQTSSCTQEKPFIVHEQYYHYYMTPFDLCYRVFHLSEHVDNKYRYILCNNDNYFYTVHGIIIFFNDDTGRLGLACDIESARINYYKQEHKSISDFYLIHQCCLILRDLCEMIENTILDVDTSIIQLPSYYNEKESS